MKKIPFILIIFLACSVFGQKPFPPHKPGAPKAPKEKAPAASETKKAGTNDFLALVREVKDWGFIDATGSVKRP